MLTKQEATLTKREAAKLLKICVPYKPDMEREICPDFICASPELLKLNGIAPERLAALPDKLYDGMDTETKMDGDDIIATRRVHVFRRTALEQLAGAEKSPPIQI